MASRVTRDLRALPFGSMIGGPLAACINAQKEAAYSTINFITSVGLKTDENNKPTGEVINVCFIYQRDNQKVELVVPLLTIVPIPYIAIDTININFKATLSSNTSTHTEYTTEELKNQEFHDNNFSADASAWGSVDRDGDERMEMNCNVSTKRDSKATRDSNYSIEATIDVNVAAHSESMPAGMAKVLEMLNQAIMLQPAKVKKEGGDEGGGEEEVVEG